jgi:hypothetical protein
MRIALELAGTAEKQAITTNLYVHAKRGIFYIFFNSCNGGDAEMKSTMKAKKTIIFSSVALALGATLDAEAIQVPDVLGLGLGVNLYTDSANFTMLAANGGVVGGGNDINMVWNGNAYTSSSDYTGPGGAASNITASTTSPFFGHAWTAHDIQVFVPGSYSFDVTLGGGNAESGTLNATVGLGQFGVHMLFDWNGNLNIDVFVVANMNSVFGSGLAYSTQTNSKGQFKCDSLFTGTIVKNCLYDGGPYGSAGQPAGSQVWMLASTDPDGDGVMGVPMAAGGPFAGFNANFNANMSPVEPVPIPAAVWLFGSGLLGLAGLARRKKSA